MKGSQSCFFDINNETSFDLKRFRGCYAIGGADLSITTDLTCATLLMMGPATEERFVTQMYWLPADGFQKRVQEDKIPYDKWREQGLVRLCKIHKTVYIPYSQNSLCIIATIESGTPMERY